MAPAACSWRHSVSLAVLIHMLSMNSLRLTPNLGRHQSSNSCRLEGSYGRETANSGAVADVDTASTQHLLSMQATLQTAVDAQRRRSAVAIASLEAFVRQSMSDVTSLKVTTMCTSEADDSPTSSLPALFTPLIPSIKGRVQHCILGLDRVRGQWVAD